MGKSATLIRIQQSKKQRNARPREDEVTNLTDNKQLIYLAWGAMGLTGLLALAALVFLAFSYSVG